MNVFDTLFPKRPQAASNRLRDRLRSRTNRLRGLEAEQLEQRQLLAITAGGVDRTTPNHFFIDSGSGLDSEYTAYSITNDATGPAIDVWVKAANFGVGKVGLAPHEDGVYHLGNLDSNTTGTAFLYFTASGPTATPQSYDIQVFDHEPLPGDTGWLVSKSFAFADVLETIEASPNQITNVSFAPANPSVGDTLTMTVDGYLGNGANRVLFAPATKTNWLPDVFELRATNITISGTPVNTPPNRLYVDTLPSPTNKQPFEVTYTFLIAGPSSTPTQTSPTQYTQDGLQSWKHHQPSSVPFPTIPALKYKLTLTKDDGQTTYTPGGTTTYTIELTNTGNIDINTVAVQDVFPGQLGPGTTWSVSYQDATAGTLPSGGAYPGPISGTVNLKKLTGKVTITIVGQILPSATGDMTNTVTATAPNDTPLTASDTNTWKPNAPLTISKLPAIETVTAGDPNTHTYSITVTNTGLSDAQGVKVDDTWPTGLVLGTIVPPGTTTLIPASPTGNFQWLIGTLLHGQSVTLSVPYTVPAGLAAGPYFNDVVASSDTDQGKPTATAETLVTVSAPLAITKLPALETVTAGDPNTHTYSITVTNTGLSDAQGVKVDDTWPTGLVLGTIVPPGTTTLSPASPIGNFQWLIGTLPHGQSVTLSVPYTVPAGLAAGPYFNNVMASSDTDQGKPTATAETLVEVSAPLTITKLPVLETVTAGDPNTHTYSITVTNTGLSDAQGVKVDDTWPTGLVLGTIVPPGTTTLSPASPTGNFQWVIGTLLHGQSVTLSVPYTVPAGLAAGPYFNNVTASSDTDEGTPTATAETLVTVSAPLTITKLPVLETVTAGDPNTHTYSITVTNTGLSDAQGVKVDDTWPTGLVLGTIVPPGTTTLSPASPTGNFQWVIGTLPHGQSVTLSVPYTVPAGLAAGSYFNNVVASSDTDEGTPTATAETLVTVSAPLTISKLPALETVTAGDPNTHTYSITVTNTGLSDAQGVKVDDTWPTGLVLGAIVPPGTTTLSPASPTGNFQWVIGTLLHGQSVTLSVPYTVPAGLAAGPYFNNVTASSDTDEGTPTATAETLVTVSAPLTISKLPALETVTAGDPNTHTYSITVTNTGLSDAQGVKVDDTWPTGLVLGTIVPPGTTTLSPASPTGNFQWVIGTLPHGQSVTLSVPYTVPAGLAAGPYFNNVVASSDTDEGTPTATAETLVTVSAPLTISKLPALETVTAGDPNTHTYSITVTNTGLSDAQGVKVDDTWPTGLVLGAIVPPGTTTLSPASPTGNFQWVIGTLLHGQSVTLSVPYTVPAGLAAGPYFNNVVASSDTDEGTPTATAETLVTVSAPLTISKLPALETVTAGDPNTHTYSITVTNTGLSDAQGVKVDDTWPTGLVLGAIVPPGTTTLSPASPTGNFQWVIGTLLHGQSVTLSVPYTVPASLAAGPYFNNVTASSDTDEGTPTATAETLVTVSAPLTISKLPALETVTAGDPNTHTYSITVTNTGLSDAQGVKVDDSWPTGLVLGTIVPPGTTTLSPASPTGNFQWVIGTLLHGQSVTLSVPYTVPAGLPAGSYFNNVVASSDTDEGTPTATAETLVTVSAPLTITKLPVLETVTAGDPNTHTYSITVTNTGLSDAQGVQVDDTWPTGLVLGTIVPPGTTTLSPASPTSDFQWLIGTLLHGQSVTLSVPYTVPAGLAAGSYFNNVTASSDTDEGTPTATAETLVTVSAPLTITKLPATVTATAGDGVTYSYVITVTNGGPSDAQAVKVDDTWPTGLVQGPITPSQGSAPSSGGSFTWDVGTIPAMGSATLTVTYTAPANAEPTSPTKHYINTATATSSITHSPTATAETVVIRVGTPEISKVGKATYIPGDVISYTLVVSNLVGPSDDTNIRVLDALPPEILSWTWAVSFLNGAGPYNGSPISGAGPIDTRINLPVGSSATFAISNAQTSPSATTDIVNTAYAIRTNGGGTVMAQWITSPPIIPTEGVPALVVGSDDGCNGRPLVTVLDERANFLASFNPYPDQPKFRGGIRVTSADVTGDGVAEIIVAPSRNYPGEVRIFTRNPIGSFNYTLLPNYSFYPFGKSYRGGVEVASGDFNGDGFNDILCGQSSGAGQVSAFVVTPSNPSPVAVTPYFSFRGFPVPYAGGVMVAAGDFGTYGANGVKLSSEPDGRAEVVVGSNSGMRATVKVYSVFGAPNVTPKLSLVKTILPFASTFRGGVTLSVSPSTELLQTNLPSDLYVGAGVGGKSLVEVYKGSTLTKSSTISTFSSFAKPNARVFAAPVDLLRNGIVDDVFGVQGLGGAGGTNGVMPKSTGIPKETTLKPALRIAPIVDSLLLQLQRRR